MCQATSTVLLSRPFGNADDGRDKDACTPHLKQRGEGGARKKRKRSEHKLPLLFGLWVLPPAPTPLPSPSFLLPALYSTSMPVCVSSCAKCGRAPPHKVPSSHCADFFSCFRMLLSFQNLCFDSQWLRTLSPPPLHFHNSRLGTERFTALLIVN